MDKCLLLRSTHATRANKWFAGGISRLSEVLRAGRLSGFCSTLQRHQLWPHLLFIYGTWELLARPIALLNTVQLGFGVSARRIRPDGWSRFRSARLANAALTLRAAQSTSHRELFSALYGGPTGENRADFTDICQLLPSIFFSCSLFHIISQTLPCHRSIFCLFFFVSAFHSRSATLTSKTRSSISKVPGEEMYSSLWPR